MLKRINIESLLQAHESLKGEIFKQFLIHYRIEIRAEEVEDLRLLASALRKSGCSIEDLDGFFVGYKIPQIGKEFDLLRFGSETIINIELKSNSTVEKIKTQLIRNKYYLGFIGPEVYSFTFVSESNELYFLRDDETLEKIELAPLVQSIVTQVVDDKSDPDALFNPSDYLVSPFNSTDKFLAGKYFLTSHQEMIKNEIIDSVRTSNVAQFFSITGGAGTGKTLLTYDIARELMGGKKNPLIIHCGLLNDGHTRLIQNGWVITPIKSYSHYDLATYDLVIVDEAQRIRPEQLEAITEKISLTKCCCILSYDKLQTLSETEKRRDVCLKIVAIKSIVQHRLKEKIRTNKEIATFIKMLFQNKTSLPMSNNGNIQINYFNSEQDAKNYLDALDKEKWEILRFTPSLHRVEYHTRYLEVSNSTSHQVIGQEFDGVVVTIDQFFSYAKNGELTYTRSAYYDMPKMLFQNITRARKRLNVVIIDNEELLSRCIGIL